MKKLLYFLTVIMSLSMTFVGCQDLDEPIANVPNIQIREASDVTSSSAYLAYYSNVKFDSVRYYLSESADMSNAVRRSNFVDGLSQGTTYYYYVVGYKTILGKVIEARSDVMSFTTGIAIRISSVTAEKWGGGQDTLQYDHFGAFVFDGDDAVYKDCRNLVVEGSNDDGWILPYEISVPSSDSLTVYAYSPYNSSYTGNTVQFTNYKYDADVLWGVSNVLSNANTNAKIHMYHKMAMVTLAIKATSSAIGTVYNYDVSGIPTSGYLNVLTGSFVNMRSSETLTRSELLYLSEKEQSMSFISFPTSFADDKVALTLNINNTRTVTVYLPATTWEPGKQYTYPVTVDGSTLSIGTVVVNDWSDYNGGDITIKDN